MSLNKPSRKRILALDYGDSRIGVAISDPEQRLAIPREILKNEGEETVMKTLKKWVTEDELERIIVGWPTTLQGSFSQQTEKTRRFIETLQANLGIPIEALDERWTTVQAEKWGGDDSVAAQILLQTYLDRARNAKMKV